MRMLSRTLSVPVFVILLALIVPPVAIGGLFLWAAVDDVPFVNVQFFPDDNGLAASRLRGSDGQSDAGSDNSSDDGGATTAISPKPRSEVVVAGADFPVNMAFAPDGRLFYNELLTGNVRVVMPDDTLLPEPFAHVDVIHAPFEDSEFQGQEWGLLGLAMDPDFELNHYVYVYFTKAAGKNIAQPTVMRFTDVNSKGENPTVIMGDLPTTFPQFPGFHVAGNIHFGHDGYLYISIGEYNSPILAQDLTAPQGKILRVRKEDGSPVPENPYLNVPPLDPRIFAFGFRNPYAFAFHPKTGELYVADNGPDTCDELDIVRRGQFYGWPNDGFPESCQALPGVPPIYNFTRAGMTPETPTSPTAPSGLEFVSGEAYPSLGDALLVCEVNTGFMRRLVLAGERQDQVVSDEVVVEDCFLDVAVAPDGAVYYSNFSEIHRLVPE